MGVIGHWRRSVLGAGGVAMLLPLGLAIGLALTTTFGGRDGLRALAQVFSGPTAPGAHGQAEAPGLESAKDVPAIPLPPRRHQVQAASPAIRGTTAPASGGTTPATKPTHSGTSRPTTTPVHHPTGGGATGGGTPSTPAPPPSSPPPPQHSALHNTGQNVADQTKQLPPPVGPVAGNAVQTVVDLIP